MQTLRDFERLLKSVNAGVQHYNEHCQEDGLPKKGAFLLYVPSERMVGTYGVTDGQVLCEDALHTEAKIVVELLRQSREHVSIFQSIGSNNGIMGSGVRLPSGEIFALTGLTRNANEACLLCGLVDQHMIERQQTGEVLYISKNYKLFFEILNGVFKTEG